MAAYPRQDVLAALERAVQYGAFSLAAIQRILAARSQPKTPLDALADDHRTYLESLSGGEPTPPRPTSDYQALLGEGAHDAEATDPRSQPAPNLPNRLPNLPTPKTPNRAAKAVTPHLLHDDVTAALRTLGMVLAPGVLDAALSAAEKESLSHLEFLHRLLAGPAEAKESVPSSDESARRGSAN